MSTTPQLLFGKYKLLELVARGGMAEVFKAKSYGVEGFEKLVVIKRILPELAQNQAFVDMAINEAKLSVMLTHANIVQVFDLGREEDTYFIVMEYVNGMDFAEALRRSRRSNRRPPLEICAYVAGETARALDYAHRRRDAQMRPLGIVHRDVSPQNVLLSFEGEIKVTDFGIAKARTTIDEGGAVKGKYAYMAPEQARGLDVDARADVYALGVVLYEALAGRNPFQERTPYETLRRVQAGEKPPLRLANADVPDELARIVEVAMARDREDRFPTAAKLYEALTGYLYTTGKRVAAHDVSDWLETLRDDPGRDDDASRMRDALEDVEPASAKTPVEIPASASHVSRPGPSTSTGLSRPKLERRDVTLLAMEFDAPSGHPGPLFEPLMPIANRYGGVVVDASATHAVLIFGAQDPDGRDTESAVRCALKVLQTAQRRIPGAALGVGVHPARLHVNPTGVPECDQWFTASVALVRDLARGASSQILASEPIGRLVGEHFELAPVKSRAPALERVPGTPLQVLRERAAHEGAGRFVGRRDAFRLVGERLARAGRDGARGVLVVGDAGAGKSRFVSEVLFRLRRMNHPVSWHATTCLPHEREVPLASIQSMLRAVLGIDETEPESVALEKVRRMRELALSPDELRAAMLVLGIGRAEDAGDPATPRALRGAALKTATRLAQDQLTVFVWDSAENMDDESRAILDDVFRALGRARVVFVLAGRPGFSCPWRELPGVDEIALGPLSDEEARQLVQQRLGIAAGVPIPRELLEDLWNKGQGNPLFIEEYLKSLVESGGVDASDGEVIYRREVAEIGVPKTLRGLVSSELTRLDASQRALLQVASVVGSRFGRDLVAEVSQMPERALEQAIDSLIERGTLSVVADDEFGFTHELHREVVYESLPLEARREMHATVAAGLERLYGDRLDEFAERLAHHYREANDRPRAVDYLVRAARRQQSEFAYAAAATNLGRAIDLSLATPSPDPALVVGLYCEFGTAAVRGRQVQTGIDRLRNGLAYVEDSNDEQSAVKILVMLGRLLGLGNQIAEAVVHFERARTLVEHSGDNSLLGEIVTAIGETFARNGEFRRAYPYLEQAARLARARGDRRGVAQALIALARCYGASGDRESALASVDQARDVLGEMEDPVLRVEIEKSFAQVHFFTRSYADSARYSERATELSREFGLPHETCVTAHNAGDAWLRLGDYKRAFTSLRASQDVAQEHGFEKMRNLNTVYLAFIDAAKFGSDEAHATIEAALAYAEAQGFTWDVLHIKYLLGVLAREKGHLEQARRLLREALALANETDNRMYAEDCETLLRDASLRSTPPGPGPAQPV